MADEYVNWTNILMLDGRYEQHDMPTAGLMDAEWVNTSKVASTAGLHTQHQLQCQRGQIKYSSGAAPH